MIAKELVETALKNAGVKRLSHVLHGQSVLSADSLNVNGTEDDIAYDAHTAAAAFSRVADCLTSKKGVDFRKTHCFVGFHDEVLCVNMPEAKVVEFLTGLANQPVEGVAEEEGGLMARVRRSVRKVVKQ